MKAKTRELAQGKWREILSQLAVDEKFLKNEHGPCPMCGGKDRFRFDDKEGRGTFYCNSCGPGDGFDLLMKVQGWSFEDAAKHIDQIVGTIEPKPFKPTQSEEDKRRNLNAVWRASQAQQALLTYLESRRLPSRILEGVKTMRGSTRLWDSKTGQHHVGVVSLVQNAEGHPVSLHRIYFENGKRWKKVMPPVGTITGAAVRLGEIEDRILCVAEGIESGLAVRGATKGLPVWCGISANGMREIKLPDGLRGLHVFADHDGNFVGPAAGMELAHRYKRQNKDAVVCVYIPKVCYEDPLDIWQRHRIWPQFRDEFNIIGEKQHG